MSMGFGGGGGGVVVVVVCVIVVVGGVLYLGRVGWGKAVFYTGLKPGFFMSLWVCYALLQGAMIWSCSIVFGDAKE